MQTIVKAKCLDQTLQLVNAPRIASGGIDEVRAEFEFCPLWDGLAKTAVFYNDPKKVYHMLLVEDACIVPAEVLAEPGVLSVGVFGIGPDDAPVRTSVLLQLMIEQGALTEATAVHEQPTPGIYEQIVAEVARLARVGEEIKQQQEEFEDEIKDNLLMVISDTEPETCPIWWLDTSYTPEDAATPIALEMEIEGKAYAVENAAITGTDDGSYGVELTE